MKKPILLGIYLANFFIILFFWWQGSAELFGSGSSGAQLALARLAGLLGMFSILTQYVLISTAPWVNRTIGQYRLTGWHMLNGKIAFILVSTHVILIKSVYSRPLSLPFVWLAAIAFIILVATVGAAMLRNKLPYKIWHSIHMLNYTIAALVILHQLTNGGDFQANPVFQTYWILIIVLATGNLIYFRLIYPKLLNRSS